MPLTAEEVAALRAVALRVLFGARNGALYGVKVRTPHAVVLTGLWHPGSVREKARRSRKSERECPSPACHSGSQLSAQAAAIAEVTATHAATLCCYAASYKLLFTLLQRARGQAAVCGRHSPRGPVSAAAAGLIAGGFWFGAPTPVNTQVVLFLFSRAMTGAAKRAAPSVPAGLRRRAWPVFAALTWALTMSLWEVDASVLATGLRSSMHEIYEDDAKRTFRQLLDWRDWVALLTHR